jgi:hypothetical protein
MPIASPCLTTEIRINDDVEFVPFAPEMVLEFDDGQLVIDRDRIRLGTSPACELRLPQGPLLHSVIRNEAGAVWIEAEQDSDLSVNWRNCRRMALRDGDVISVAGMDITIRQSAIQLIGDNATKLSEDVSQMSAEELCDQILSEQTEVDAFESKRLQGWQELIAAMKRAMAGDQSQNDSLNTAPAIAFSDDCERLLDQIREMSDLMNGRNQELDACEGELVAATALLQETHDRVSRQIEELLNQIGDVSTANTLRASA